MTLNTNLKNILLVVFTTLILSACSTAKKSGDIDGDVYTGKETVEYLAAGVPDRVFFATNKSSLTTASRATLRKQATFLRKNKNLNVTIEGHSDERDHQQDWNMADRPLIPSFSFNIILSRGFITFTGENINDIRGTSFEDGSHL